MAKIKHVAITCEDPDAVARFYKEGFDLVEVARNDRQVQLSDGDINLTILKWKTDKDADVGPNGENYSGIHHIGFQVDSLQDTGARLQDIEGANRLLDDNGVLDTDGDGVREYNGVPLRITYQTSVNAIRQDTQALVRGWWRQIGIETELVQHDASVFFGGDPVDDKEASYHRFFADVQMYASGSGIDPQQSLSGPLCKHIPTKGNNWALGNIARSCNPEYDRLHAQLEQTPIGPEREALVKQLHDMDVQDYYGIPLVNRGFVSAHLNTLKGVRINGWGSEMWNIAVWRR